ncbi:MAG TPA: CHASE2 domain-containing protein [Geminicoccus sp.]|uniref:CHASE2 domain-containing protein n=1 Tax=Geminicoccus sp. TaxID=2024832 RepID=UPI002E3676E8|nr:CHASE2 domain-containing protein [Geminicoccus sp.]HEX2526411.1 CHASE2 domain-containing protein [Geminicoccus sp.]
MRAGGEASPGAVGGPKSYGSSWRPATSDLLSALTVLAGAALLFALVVMARAHGWFERLELLGHDLMVNAYASAQAVPDPGIVVVGITEADRRAYGGVPTDGVVATALEAILAGEPAAVGIDLFRGDMPVGPLGTCSDPAGFERLSGLLGTDPRLYMILDVDMFASTEAVRQSPLAPMLEGYPRLASAEMVSDEADRVLRRGLLTYVLDDELMLWSIGARVALATLERDGLQPLQTEDGTLVLGGHHMPPLGSNDGPYVDLDAAGYQRLLSWPARQLPVFAMGDVVEGRVDPEEFTGKTVLIGPMARSSKDYFTGVLFEGNEETTDRMLPKRSIYGVEVHAQLAAQMLLEARGQIPVLRTLASSSTLALLALAATGGMLAGALTRRPVTSMLVVTSGALAIPAAAWVAMGAGLWVSWVPHMVCWVLAAGLGFLSVAWRETRKREAISGLFRTYLPPAVADQLWAERDELVDGGRPVPRTLPATVLFSDIRGFTGITETLQPRDLFAWLERFHGRMTDLVAAHGGIVADFMGDGMMAVFGAPIPRTAPAEIEQDALAACRAALAIAQALPVLGKELQAQGLPIVRIRIGIHTGDVMAGAIGGRDRLQYALLGDTTNIAARLEQVKLPGLPGDDDHCRILISADTYRLVQGQFTAEPISLPEPLKGKTRPVDVLRLLGPTIGRGTS